MTEKPLTVKIWHIAETGAYMVQVRANWVVTIPEEKALAFSKKEELDIIHVQKQIDIQ